MAKTQGSHSTEELKRYLGVLQEQHLDALKVTQEGIEAVVKRAVKQEIGRVEKVLNDHTKILNSHTETLNSHTEMIGQLMVDVTGLKSDVTELKTDMTEVKGRLKRIEGANLERRVRVLEQRP